MSRRTHEAAGEIFLAACRLPPEEREEFLREACPGDDALREEVESLLAHHREDDPTGGFLGRPEEREPFRPGELFAGRYRILNLLGQGGMGEVYRAHDEMLDQPVAVKRLRARSPGAAEAMLQEVRLARSVTHSSVVRVFDVAMADGEPFFTMELVEGEDLGSLLRRAGRLPSERVLELARQLLAGLAAAHAQGVIHRDLKPGNVLIDERGQARITDFGIALPRQRGGMPDAAGTPGYMAPEQWTGGGVDERTDLYSLALLLHEALTGRAVFAAGAPEELARRQLRERPPAPSRRVPEVDPGLESALLAALEVDPALRPPSALAMAAALPGGDALSMALDVGVTPPVEVVAAAGPRRTLAPRLALGLLVAVAALLVALFPLTRVVHPLHAAGEMEDPAVLEDRAETLLEDLGFPVGEGGSKSGFLSDPEAPSSSSSLLFWWMELQDRPETSFAARTLQAPTEGRLVTVLDPRGRLVYLRSDVPPSPVEAPESGRSEAEGLGFLLRAADFPGAVLEATEGGGGSPVPAGERWHWEGERPGEEGELRIEAATAGGRPVLFSLQRMPKETAGEDLEEAETRALVALMVALLVLLPALPMAWRNLKRGRGDRRGARRLLGFVAMVLTASWVLSLGNLRSPYDTPEAVFRDRALQLILHGAWVWVAYLGLEPLARRWWPETLVAWNRWLAGSWRDPLVGRSLLAGSFSGTALTVFGGGVLLLQGAWGADSPRPLHGETLNAARSLGSALSAALGMVPLAIYNCFVMLLLLVLLQAVLRRRKAALPVFVLSLMVLVGLLGNGTLGAWLFGAGFAATAALLLMRYGLATFCCAYWVHTLLGSFPLTLDFDAWFAGSGLTAVGAVLLVAVVGYRLTVKPPGGWPRGASARLS